MNGERRRNGHHVGGCRACAAVDRRRRAAFARRRATAARARRSRCCGRCQCKPARPGAGAAACWSAPTRQIEIDEQLAARARSRAAAAQSRRSCRDIGRDRRRGSRRADAQDRRERAAVRRAASPVQCAPTGRAAFSKCAAARPGARAGGDTAVVVHRRQQPRGRAGAARAARLRQTPRTRSTR